VFDINDIIILINISDATYYKLVDLKIPIYFVLLVKARVAIPLCFLYGNLLISYIMHNLTNKIQAKKWELNQFKEILNKKQIFEKL